MVKVDNLFFILYECFEIDADTLMMHKAFMSYSINRRSGNLTTHCGSPTCKSDQGKTQGVLSTKEVTGTSRKLW